MYTLTASSGVGGGAVGQLIDLGFDLNTTATPATTTAMAPSSDIMSQLAELGMCLQMCVCVFVSVWWCCHVGISSQPLPRNADPLDEFDMFAQSRTAYSLTRYICVCVCVCVCVCIGLACVHSLLQWIHIR